MGARRAAVVIAVALAVGALAAALLLVRGDGDGERETAPPPGEPEPERGTEVLVPGVRVSTEDDAIVAANEDGEWTVRTACTGPFRRGDGDATVGPGYVSRLVTPEGDVLVDDEGPPEPLNDPGYGGLGGFAWHHARGRPGALRLDRDNAWELSGRICAEDNGGFGVASSTVLAAPFAASDESGEPYVGFALEVELSDRWTHPLPLMRVRYRYRVLRAEVRSWIAVTQLCPDGRCGATSDRAFVKEPKLAVGLRGEAALPYRRSVILDDEETPVCLYVAGGPLTGPLLATGQCAHPRRTRVRFDAGTSTSGAEGGCGEIHCLEVAAWAYPAEDDDVVPGGAAAAWAEAELGFDAWAVAAARRPAALDEDTGSIDGVVWGCHGGSPDGALLRRWETIARLGGDGRHRALAVLLNAWEGGRGGYDCEPLLRTFGPGGETWAAFLSYSLR